MAQIVESLQTFHVQLLQYTIVARSDLNGDLGGANWF